MSQNDDMLNSVIAVKGQVNYSKNDGMFYGILSLFASALCFMMSYSTIYSFPWQSHWSTTTGIVKEVSWNGKAQNVDYSYSADNRNFVAKKKFHWHGRLLHPGDQVVVRYDPVAVAHSVIQSGLTTATGLYIFAALLSLMAAVAQFKAPTAPATSMKPKLY